MQIRSKNPLPHKWSGRSRWSAKVQQIPAIARPHWSRSQATAQASVFPVVGRVVTSSTKSAFSMPSVKYRKFHNEAVSDTIWTLNTHQKCEQTSFQISAAWPIWRSALRKAPTYSALNWTTNPRMFLGYGSETSISFRPKENVFPHTIKPKAYKLQVQRYNTHHQYIGEEAARLHLDHKQNIH